LIVCFIFKIILLQQQYFSHIAKLHLLDKQNNPDYGGCLLQQLFIKSVEIAQYSKAIK
jgi:hypothetical protein